MFVTALQVFLSITACRHVEGHWILFFAGSEPCYDELWFINLSFGSFHLYYNSELIETGFSDNEEFLEYLHFFDATFSPFPQNSKSMIVFWFEMKETKLEDEFEVRLAKTLSSF